MKRSQIIHEFKLFLDYWGIRKEYLDFFRRFVYKEKRIKYLKENKYCFFYGWWWFDSKNNFWRLADMLWHDKLDELEKLGEI